MLNTWPQIFFRRRKWKAQVLLGTFFFFLKILFIYLTKRERENTSRQSSRQREGEKQIPTKQGAQSRARSQDPRIITQAEGSPLTD